MRNSLIIVVLVFLMGCGDSAVLTPKPRIYPRVNYPTKKYVLETFGDCPFQAEIPVYGKVKHIEDYFGKKAINHCWYTIVFPSLNAALYLSYVPMQSYQDYLDFRKDTHTIVETINKRSNYMAEIPFSKGKGLGGLVYDFEGPAASPFQFFITDSTSRNIRGSLYFHTEIRPDSLAPIIKFLEDDMKHFINTFQWKDS